MNRLGVHLARLPIRLRLTVWYGILLAAVLVLFGATLWFGLRIRLTGTFDDQLREQAALTLATVRVNGATLAFDPQASAVFRRDGSFVRLLDRSGAVVADTSAALGAVPIAPADVAAAMSGVTRFSSVAVANRSLRIVTVPIAEGNVTVGVLQVGMPRAELDEVMHELLVAILVAAPAAVLVALAGGYLLARHALDPVAAITLLAAGIGGGDDLHARLGLALPDDELGRLASTFDAMLARIETAFERQRRFTGDAAHELRTPLALMRGRIDLARSAPRTPAEHLATLEGLDGDLERLGAVVGALLLLARSDNGRLVVEREPFDLAVTIRRVVEQYADAAVAAGITLRAETTPAGFDGDEDLLVQVLVNLVDNALAHTPPGGVVAVGCAAAANEVRLWVVDSGEGIDPVYHQRVFDRFYRVDTGRARQTGGAGLGLSTCRAIVESHGGAIALTGAVGRGTRVEALLPTAAAPSPREPASSPASIR